MNIDISQLKDKIIRDNKISILLQELGMHDIKNSGKHYSCAFPDGDNKNGCIVYTNSLNVEAYTRDIKDSYGTSDIISLVSFINKTYFLNSIKWICDVCGYDYYDKEEIKIPLVLKWIDNINKLNSNSNYCDLENEFIQPISENILNYFEKYPNKIFKKDNIDYTTQKFFQIGYCKDLNRITIPIRDELGTLVGIKGRIHKDLENITNNKYIYIISCPKTKILFGLDKTFKYIKEKKLVYIAESEKAVMQAWSKGIRNVVSIGGHQLSEYQVKKLTHLNVNICLAYDDLADYTSKKVDGETFWEQDKNFYQREKEKFLPTQKVYKIIDKERKILKAKDSPFDHMNEWDKLLKMREMI